MSVNRSNSRRPTREEAYSPDPEDQQRKEGMRPQSASKGVFSFTARRTTSVAPTSSTSPQSEGRVQRWTLDDELTGSDERRTSAVEQSGGANRRSRNMSIFGQTSSITGSSTTSLERKLEASMAALGQQLQVELKRHAAESQQRLTETEDRLKMRVTQMERLLLETTQQQHMQVPQMQQQPQQQAAGSPAGSPAEMHSSGALCGAPSSADLPSGGGNVMPPRSLNGANGLDGGSPFKIRSALGPSVGPMRPGGDGTHSGLGEAERAQMHSLVESDGEIQALLRDMRRQGAKLKPLKTNDVLAPRPGTSSGGGAAIGAVDYGANVADEGRTSGRTSRMLRLLCGAVIHPEAKFRSVWNALMALLIIYCGVTIPLEIAFEDDMILAWCGAESSVRVRAECASFQAWFWINILIDLWFIADIVINLRTGFMAEGHFVNDDRLAAKHYVTKGSFVFDCIGSFPINLLLLPVQDDDSDASSAYGRTNKMLRLLRVAKMTKLLRLLKLGAYLEYVEVVIKFNPGLLRVIKLCLISLLCCHWFGCLWWLVSDIEMADQNLMSPWPTPQNEWHPPPWLKYSDDFSLKYWHSYFWGAGMALGMVPRDVEPITTLEAVISTLTMFGGLILAAVVISSFTSAFASMDNKRALAGQQLDVIRNYLLLKAVPNDLRSRILEYYQYIFTSSQSMEDLQLLQHMPPNLATQLALSINAKLISRCSFFHEMSDASLATLVQSLAPLVFVPGQIICTEGAPLQRVYFLNRGQVQLVRTVMSTREAASARTEGVGVGHGAPAPADVPAEKVVRVVSETDSIGMDDFTTADRLIGLTARALSYCDVMSLTIRDLDAALHYDALERMRVAAVRAESERRHKEALDAAPASAAKKSVEGSARLRRVGAMMMVGHRLGGTKKGDKESPDKGASGGSPQQQRRNSNGRDAGGGVGAGKGSAGGPSKNTSNGMAESDDTIEYIDGGTRVAASPSPG